MIDHIRVLTMSFDSCFRNLLLILSGLAAFPTTVSEFKVVVFSTLCVFVYMYLCVLIPMSDNV